MRRGDLADLTAFVAVAEKLNLPGGIGAAWASRRPR